MKNRRRPRALSLTLPNTRQPYFVFNGERYLMRNVSEHGIGLWVPREKAFGLTPKTKIKGDIVIDREIHPVTLEVVHSTKGYVGLRILQADRALTRLFENLLEPSQYAATLVAEKGSGEEDPDTSFFRFVFRSDDQVRLRFWIGRGLDIKSVEIHLLDKWVRRNQFGPIQTGVLPDSLPLKGAEELLLVHSEPNQEFLQAATQFLGSAPPPIPSALLWHFLETGEQVFVSQALIPAVG